MNKIAIVSIFYAPEQIGVSKYTTEKAEWLSRQGADVRVLTAFPFYPEWKRHSGYPTWHFQQEIINNVTVTRCPLWIPSRVTALSRLAHLFTYGISSNLAVLSLARWKPDLVMLVMPTMVSMPAIFALRLYLVGSTLWLHVQDFELDLASEVVEANPLLVRLVAGLERWSFRRFDVVSTISETMMRRLMEVKAVSEERCFYLPNWIDSKAIYPMCAGLNYRTEWKVSEEQIVVLYSGNFGQKYDFKTLFEAAQILSEDTDIVFVLCGDGAARLDVEQLSQTANNVMLFPLQPIERLNELLNSADIHVLPQKSNASDSVMPSKVLNIFACAKPIVATVYATTELGGVIGRVGKIARPGKPHELAHVIKELANDSHEREELGRKAYDYVTKSFEKETVLSAFLERLSEAD